MGLHTYIRDIHSLVMWMILTLDLGFGKLWMARGGGAGSCEGFVLGWRWVGLGVKGWVGVGMGSLGLVCGGPGVCIRWRAFYLYFLAYLLNFNYYVSIKYLYYTFT